MADELYRWLDRETAERLLSGESLEAVDAADRDQAERLAKTLEALTAEPPPTSEELPGEAAALAAFRTARKGREADREDASATVGDRPGPPDSGPADAGLVRLGRPSRAVRRPRWARPVRLGLAAALAVGMVGGVAVAAGTGVLPTPFDRDEPARPAATVSAPAPTERPLISPSPETGGQDEPTPDGGSGASAGPGAPEDPAATGGSATDRDSASGDREKPGGWWKNVTSYCRDVRDGRPLTGDHRRTLENAAGSSARVWKYCKNVLSGAGESTRSQRDGEENAGQDKGRDQGDDDQDKDSGKDRRRDDEGEGDPRGRHGRDGHRTQSAARLHSAVTALLPVRTPITSR
ncbi:hypothetical protein IM697_39485 [Streptomyces ferrugineus]|uniref:Extensin n=1 Tax=Streptomyces ferrugineus TaxID=1413221 RepID=A0A7M2SIF5_9ACTN|nr:hypothetical protein [Streptomyces ferrugineus]QOV36052.1 hypothetical protein IM697_39485 [Streptomyces ferrugineus]